MNNKLLIAIVLIAIVSSGCLKQTEINEDNSKSKNQELPQSLAQYYETKPSLYLIKMFELSESMVGITVNIQQGDMENASKYSNEFSQNYEHSAEMVPEWQEYYDLDAVDKIGTALEINNIPGVFDAMGEVGATCTGCHVENNPAVWNKYNWNDFRDLKMNTPQGPQQWVYAKNMYLLAGYDGIGINIKQGNPSAANQSFYLFKTMFYNMSDTCKSCHTSEPRYYVSEDVQTMIDEMGEKINAGDSANLSAADGIRQGIGMECYRCHVLHMPAQYAKESATS